MGMKSTLFFLIFFSKKLRKKIFITSHSPFLNMNFVGNCGDKNKSKKKNCKCVLGKRSRERFTEFEDAKLKEMISSYGFNWELILSNFPHKTKRQLNDRWFYYLNPELKAAPFTSQEDELLETQLNEIGPRWRIIATFFPGRTDISLKNRWKMIQRHRLNEHSKYQIRKKFSPQSSSSVSIIETIKNDKTNNQINKYQQLNIESFDTFEID